MDKEQCDTHARELLLHAEQIGKLFSQVRDTNDRLLNIEKTINQVRNMVVGAIAYALVSEFGILEAIKLSGGV